MQPPEPARIRDGTIGEGDAAIDRAKRPRSDLPAIAQPDFRSEAFARYRSTHVGPRKGDATLDAFRRRFPKWDRLIGPYLPPDRTARVVDGGCGSGPIVAWLVERGYQNARGVDASAEEVEAAAALGLPVSRGEISTVLEDEAGRLDFLILRNVLEHMGKPDILDTLRRARAALRPGAALFLQVPNAEGPFGARLRYADFTHEIAFTPASIGQVLRLSGFDHFEVGAVRPGASGVRGLAFRLVEFAYQVLLRVELGRGSFVVTQDLYAVARR